MVHIIHFPTLKSSILVAGRGITGSTAKFAPINKLLGVGFDLLAEGALSGEGSHSLLKILASFRVGWPKITVIHGLSEPQEVDFALYREKEVAANELLAL